MENLKRNCSYRVMFGIFGIRTGQIMPGVGILFRFFDPGAGVLH